MDGLEIEIFDRRVALVVAGGTDSVTRFIGSGGFWFCSDSALIISFSRL